MAATKQPQTLADYVTMALSPVLIMALVGSLVFFLLEVIYGHDQFEGRLRWTFFWFIFGMVLVARISIHPAVGGRAKIYGLVLAVAVFVALARFFTLEAVMGAGSAFKVFDWLVCIGLIGLIWWCSHRLTWDCTHIDDKVDASGKGVLEAAGLDAVEAAPSKPAGTDELSASATWLERYRRYREEQRKLPHTPGVWVVYFSLAALPLFGLGQALIPAEELESRQYTFKLMSIYVASGLGLLVTTSFLGLRRYLRQRKLQMPKKITTMWMGLGGATICGLLLLGAFLPRPHAEYPLLDLVRYETQEQDASQYAQLDDGAGKGEGRSSSDTPKGDKKASDGAGTKLDKEGSVRGNEKSKNQDPAGARSKGKDGSSSENKDGSAQGKEEGKASKSKDKSRPSQDSKSKDDAKGESSGDPPKAREEKERKGGRQSTPSRSRPRSSSAPRTPASLPGWLNTLLTILKWVVFAALALAVVFFLFTRGLGFLANFSDWARRLLEALRAFWAGLFGKEKVQSGLGAADFEAAEDKPWTRPFAAYHNPFLTELSERLTPNQLVRYSFEALQAWARERDMERRRDETPLEFVERLGEEVPGFETESKRLVTLFTRVCYANANLTPASLDTVREFWQRLESVVEQPLSA